METLCLHLKCIDRQPIAGIHVNKENYRTNKVRTLHRNMLLPFIGLPCEILNDNPKASFEVPVHEGPERNMTEDSTSSDSDESDSSLSEETGIDVPQHPLHSTPALRS